MGALKRIVLAGLVLVMLFYGFGGWHFSSVLDERALDAESMRASYPGEYDLRVKRVNGVEVVLEPLGEDPVPELVLEGRWGLRWEGGYGWVDASSERWSLKTFRGDPPESGASALLDPRMYPDIGSMRVAPREVSVRGPLGDLPAWFWPGQRHAWVLVVHGNSMTRLDGVRMVPFFQRSGFPVLVPTYRNDPGAPEDPSGRLRYGLTEWDDLEAAVRYALDHGATDVILDGYSMGGGVVMAFLQRSELADRVTAIVMDAPMLDFGQTVDDNASRETLPVIGMPLPSSLTVVAKQFAAIRFDVDWKELDYLGTDPGVPTLIFHGTEDLTVPVGTSVDFARRYADVALERCPDAGHIQCWNVDPERYAQVLGHFLRENAREEAGVLSCPPGSVFGGADAAGIEPAPTIQRALAREDVGSGTLQEIPVPDPSQADAAYVLIRDGFPVRYYGLRHITDPRGPTGWGVETFDFCGDVGMSG